MTKDEIIQAAMDSNSMMVLEMREMDAKDEFLLEFSAAIIAATKEEDAKICEEWGAWNDTAQGCAIAIRASKQGQS